MPVRYNDLRTQLAARGKSKLVLAMWMAAERVGTYELSLSSIKRFLPSSAILIPPQRWRELARQNCCRKGRHRSLQ
eukprot:381667-Karenia_brevis.AAC.1